MCVCVCAAEEEFTHLRRISEVRRGTKGTLQCKCEVITSHHTREGKHRERERERERRQGQIRVKGSAFTSLSMPGDVGGETCERAGDGRHIKKRQEGEMHFVSHFSTMTSPRAPPGLSRDLFTP